ncbi:MAG: PLDc_N domain-containing protein [Candidatus Omnitrophica bacterium]|nr:PLDc_N domain-containing protein [Candidatus Omnitrophota bacterium]
MQGLIGLVILVLDIIAIVDAVKSSMDTGKKVLWIAVILLVPIIGLILYFLVGKKKK